MGRWLRPSACTAIALFSTGTVAPKARVGSDFSLLPEFEQAGFVLSSGEQRVEWMMRRYRRNPTFGLVGNRLLVHDLVRSFGFPQAPVIYGAFFGAQLGAWPQYSREGLRRALEAGHAAFVVESALAAETSSIVSAPTRVLGVSEVASFIERALQTPPIRDGPAHSMYERRGVVVRAPSSAVPGGPPAVALGLHIVIDPRGLRRIGSAHAAPVGAREGAYVNLCDRQEVVCMEQRAALCGWLVPLLRRLRAHLQKVAMRLSTALDADWLRVDFVISPDGTFVVDKVRPRVAPCRAVRAPWA